MAINKISVETVSDKAAAHKTKLDEVQAESDSDDSTNAVALVATSTLSTHLKNTKRAVIRRPGGSFDRRNSLMVQGTLHCASPN